MKFKFQSLRTHQMELAAHGTPSTTVPTPTSPSSPLRSPASSLRAVHAAAHVQGAIYEQPPEPVRAPESAADGRAPSSSSHELSLEPSLEPASSATAAALVLYACQHLVLLCHLYQCSNYQIV